MATTATTVTLTHTAGVLWQDKLFGVEFEETDIIGSIWHKCALGKILGEARAHAKIHAIRRDVRVNLNSSEEPKQEFYKFTDYKRFNPDDFYDRVENGISSRRVAKDTDKVIDCIFD